MRLQGALRIRKKVKADAATESAEEPSEPEQPPADDYMQRLLKMLPSEVVGIYLIGRETATTHHAIPVWASIGLALVLLFRAAATRPVDTTLPFYRGIQWGPVLAAAGAFVIWVHAMGDKLPYLEAFEPWMASLAVLVWAILVPWLFEGDPADQG